MRLSFEYDAGHHPAFPILELTIRGSSSSDGQPVVGLIDTGSDATQFPLALLQAIDARQIDQRWVRDLSGIRLAVPVYSVEVQIGEIRLPFIEVIGRRGVDDLIIGRDILNQFIITLNGLAQVTEVSD